MAPPLPPNPSLIAIVLVINAKAGPRFVFHYPAHPRDDLPPTHSIWKGYEDGVADGDTSSEVGYWSSDDEGDGTSEAVGSRIRRSRGGPDDEDDSSDNDKRARPLGAAAWETVFGFSTAGLEKVLSPARSYQKKKFELGLEPLTYLGCPIYIREDGSWRKRREKKQKKKGEIFMEEVAKSSPRDSTDSTGLKEMEEVVDSKTQEVKNGGIEDEEDKKSTTSEDDRKAMSMFNIVFVMNPPVLEHNLRIKEMYEYVVKKFAKALKYEQARSNWVWRQSEMILNMKERAKEEGTSMSTLWHRILSKSSLARALSEVYLSISSSKIAHVFINDTFDISLQIPQISSISELPTAIEPQMPGLWLTTASSIEEDDEELDGTILAKHFALLLLDDVENILKDIDHEHGPREVSHPLAQFVQIVKPTMSFLQISQTHNISLRRIQVLSRHLIYWRRARAIPPLHQRDKYIVSPNAKMSDLPTATIAYAARFPSLPSLPKMLSMLSGQPRAYSSLIPSKDHREAYLEILAWLMKGGWVTQLRIFAWVRVSRDIKAMVKARTTSGKDEGHQNDKEEEEEEDSTTTMMLDPHKANGLESEWLDTIRACLSTTTTTRTTSSSSSFTSPPNNNNNDDDEKEIWSRLVRYFNGRYPLEKIPVREGLKRKDVWRWLALMENKGVLVVVRHW